MGIWYKKNISVVSSGAMEELGYGAIRLDNKNFPHILTLGKNGTGQQTTFSYDTWRGKSSGGWGHWDQDFGPYLLCVQMVMKPDNYPAIVISGAARKYSGYWGNCIEEYQARTGPNIGDWTSQQWARDLTSLYPYFSMQHPNLCVHLYNKSYPGGGAYYAGDMEGAYTRIGVIPGTLDNFLRNQYRSVSDGVWYPTPNTSDGWGIPTFEGYVSNIGTIYQSKILVEAIDQDTGYVHIVRGSNGNGLIYQFYAPDDGGWMSSAEIIEDSTSSYLVSAVSMTIDNNGYPVLAYQSSTGGLRVASRKNKTHTAQSNNWNKVLIDTGKDSKFTTIKATWNNDLIVGATNRNVGNWEIRCYFLSGPRPWFGTRRSEVVHTVAGGATYAWGQHDMDVDSNGYPHFIYPVQGGTVSNVLTYYYARYLGDSASLTKGLFYRDATPATKRVVLDNTGWTPSSPVVKCKISSGDAVNTIFVDPNDECAGPIVKVSSGNKGLLIEP